MKKFLSLAGMLGWQDIRQAYRRSAIGPFWLTISMAVQILTIGLVFGLIFKSDLTEYLPFLAASIISWGFISNSISEGSYAFISAESIIKQLNIPSYVHIARVLWKNLIGLAHNLIILPAVLIFFGKVPGLTLIAFFPAVVVVATNLAWVVWILGIVSARFRDLPPITSSMITIAFYVTPVMWNPIQVGNTALAHLLLGLNPLYHWMQLLRLPLLGEWPTIENWAVALLTSGLGWAGVALVHSKFKSMIAYWL